MFKINTRVEKKHTRFSENEGNTRIPVPPFFFDKKKFKLIVIIFAITLETRVP